MPNIKNLEKGKNTRFKSGKEAAENGRKGGIASGEAKRAKKTVKLIIDEILNTDIKDMPQFAKYAKKIGIESDRSIKDLYIIICLLNSLKRGDLSDIERLVKILGEDVAETDNGNLTEILTAIRGVDSD